MGRFSKIKTPTVRPVAASLPVAVTDTHTPDPIQDVEQKSIDVEAKAKVDKQKQKEAAVKAELLKTKLRIHAQLLDSLDLASLDGLDQEAMRSRIETKVSEMVKAEKLRMNQKEIAQFSLSIIDEMIGLGPLEPLLADETISDKFFNTSVNEVFLSFIW